LGERLIHTVSFLEEKAKTVIIAVTVLVVIAGTIYSVSLGDALRYPDEKEYFAIAKNLVTNGLYSIDGIHPTAYRPPGYPLLLSIFLSLGFGVVQLRILNFLFLAAAMFLLRAVVEKHSNPIAGLASVLLLLFYPVVFYTAGTLYPQTFGSFLLVLFLYLILEDHKTFKRSVLGGLTIGVLMLTISTFVLAFVVSVLFLLIHRRDIRTAWIVALVSGLVIVPWTARNFSVFSSFVPFSTNSGINLLLGNSPNTTANSGVNVDLSQYYSHTWDMSEIQKDVYYRSEAMRWVSDNKKDAFSLYLRKMLNHFNYKNELATQAEGSAFRDLLMLVPYAPLLILFVLRILLYKKYPFGSIEVLFVLLYVLNALFQAVFFTRIRFRLPYDFLLVGVVSILLANVLGRSSRSLVRNEKT
jgi:hypothetical protein